MAELQSRRLDKFHYKDYVARAVQLLNAAERAYESLEWDACAITAVHSAVSASDALCTLKLGQRSAGQNHQNAVRLFKTIDAQDKAIVENAGRLARLLAEKNASAYEEKPVQRKEAEYLLTEAKKFLSFVESRLPERPA